MDVSDEFIIPSWSGMWNLQASKAHLQLQEQGVVGIEGSIWEGHRTWQSFFFKNPDDHEDLSVLDELCVRLIVEYQEVVDIQEALRCNNMLEKENIHNASQFLAPFPAPVTPFIIHWAPSPMRRLHLWTTKCLQNLLLEQRNSVWCCMIPTK